MVLLLPQEQMQQVRSNAKCSNIHSYVAWNWKANGAGVSNTDGTITSTVSANTDSGFSIVTYTPATNTTSTLGHGLGIAPSLIIAKSRSTTSSWYVYHASLGATKAVFLNKYRRRRYKPKVLEQHRPNIISIYDYANRCCVVKT
jgi:hypothetical protein